MTIDEAIKQLTKVTNYTTHRPGFRTVTSIKLGIEALKQFKYQRALGAYVKSFKLPGETEE